MAGNDPVLDRLHKELEVLGGRVEELESSTDLLVDQVEGDGRRQMPGLLAEMKGVTGRLDEVKDLLEAIEGKEGEREKREKRRNRFLLAAVGLAMPIVTSIMSALAVQAVAGG